MNARSASPAEAAPADTASTRPVLIWDAPVRVFHWLAVLSFAGAWLSAESERWRLLHVTLGYTLAGLIAFRIVWGLVGTRHARFVNFVRGPAAVAAYLRGLWRRSPDTGVGHNPAGALAIVGLIVLAIALTASGWGIYSDRGGEWLAEVHEGAANTMLLLVGMHVAGVLFSSLAHRRNLVASMFSGRQPGRPEDAIRSAWRSVAVLMLVAVLGFWGWQWQAAPASTSESVASHQGTPPAGGLGRDPDDDANDAHPRR